MLSDRIVITGDLTRVNDNMEMHQAPNITWFSKVFRPIFEDLGCSVDTFGATDDDFPANRFHKALYDGVGASTSIHEKWAAHYDTHLPLPARILLLEAMGPAMFVLFEAPPSMLSAIDEAGHTYLNFRVHPLRFASDLIFAVKTNDKYIARNLRRFTMRSDFVRREIDDCRKRWRGGENTLPRNSTVFMAQTSQDGSLIEEGKFTRIDEFAEKLKKLVRAGKPIFYKRHPLESNQKSFDFWLGTFPTTVEIFPDISSYELFSQSEHLNVITISSGSAYEAKLLGHSPTYLSSRYWGGRYYSDYTPITHEYWYPSFWESALTEKRVITSAIQSFFGRGNADNELPFVKDRLRSAINFEWSKR
ncbi:hypothetical protein O3S81_11480 [Agrobacterium sp. SOY23]|uniref:hypothetical protein n=1 Tax=Agrobacterium sp. SOY23 TaxID=3014555 RepID=UPI0022B06EBE|nr:hypothetical protein [Agrobacterium sp. SOY23]MCZ4430319.1 hypothetical protein [Agrobacterium sp. SOY23]